MKEQVRFLLSIAQRGPVVHPFLFAIYPILFLWANNQDELSRYSSTADLLPPIAISAAVALVLLALTGLILRDWRKAGLLVALFLIMFFAYGHVHEAIANSGIVGFPKHRYLFPVWLALSAVGTVLFLLYRSNLRTLTNVLNIVAFVLVLFALVSIVGHELSSGARLAEADNASAVTGVVDQEQVGPRPDIYYITAEGYDSSRSLGEFHGYDNTPFTTYLKDKGFRVAPDSNANYANTAMSLASSLNMQHLTHFADENPGGAWYVYYDISRDTKALRFARAQGYKVLHLREWYMPSGLGDLYFGCEKGGRVSLHADEFAGALLHTTAMEPILIKFRLLEFQQRNLRLCDFSQLIKAKDLDGPKLVLIHLLVPGEPFAVGPDGGARRVDEPRQAYEDQVTFTNKMLREVVDSLLSEPGDSPVIVIQGDHGQDAAGETLDEFYRWRLGILNAYYLPHGGDSLWYPTITPVNTFRIIFNYYFGADFELLEDRSYYSEEPFEFIDVTDVVKQSAN